MVGCHIKPKCFLLGQLSASHYCFDLFSEIYPPDLFDWETDLSKILLTLGCSRPREGLSVPSLQSDLQFYPCWRQNVCYHRVCRFWWTGIFHLSRVFWQALQDAHSTHTRTLHVIHWWLWRLHKECSMQ